MSRWSWEVLAVLASIATLSVVLHGVGRRMFSWIWPSKKKWEYATGDATTSGAVFEHNGDIVNWVSKQPQALFMSYTLNLQKERVITGLCEVDPIVRTE